MTTRTRITSLPRRLALLVLAVAAAAPVATVVTAVATPEVADAFRPRSSSEEVAASASRALEALDAWHAEGDPARYLDYLAARDLTAELSATELGVDPAELALA